MRIISRLIRMFTSSGSGRRPAGGGMSRTGGTATATRGGGIGSLIRRFLR